MHAVTAEEIRERADVSPRTFSRYFPAKEDVAFTNDIDRRAVMRDAPARELPGETLAAAARRAVAALLEYIPGGPRHRATAGLTARQRARARATSPRPPPNQPARSPTLPPTPRQRRPAHIDARLPIGALIEALNAGGDLWLDSDLRGDPRALMNRAMKHRRTRRRRPARDPRRLRSPGVLTRRGAGTRQSPHLVRSRNTILGPNPHNCSRERTGIRVRAAETPPPSAHWRRRIPLFDRHRSGAPAWPRPVSLAMRNTSGESGSASGAELHLTPFSIGRMSGKGHSRTYRGLALVA